MCLHIEGLLNGKLSSIWIMHNQSWSDLEEKGLMPRDVTPEVLQYNKLIGGVCTLAKDVVRSDTLSHSGSVSCGSRASCTTTCQVKNKCHKRV
jgi:hypothetical protein